MASSSSRRMSWRKVTPVVAIAAFGLAACSNSEEPSDIPGTTPPVWTGAADPGAVGAPGDAPSDSHGSGGAGVATATLRDADGAEVGSVTFRQDGDHVTVTTSVEDQTPGFHGFHVHSIGACEPNSVAPTGGEPGDFLSAGGHFQVDGRSGHPASGDLTSIQVLADGTAELVTTTDSFTVEDLENGDTGTAIMIHAGPDNFGNIPARYAPAPDQVTLDTGDAGARVACGVIHVS
ncbi:superoxide dismutase [Rhodococcus sp. WMMA185]|uniref:superoxide dismutase[Cu-Zn] n=1 Tax=Rhodococcus sp. WMMA185 TaxID=679318 RepID=UPI0008782799|nr:superoxide dismutase family protein [Rhodococcus sp. WMMA185]AOW93279.1 superoxide dismutase [Rhodococcus sp. WMMA185]